MAKPGSPACIQAPQTQGRRPTAFERTRDLLTLPLIVALVPLVIAPGLVFYFDVTPKVALLLLGVALALPWFAPAKLWSFRPGRWFCGLLAIQAASLILSTALSS